MLGFLQTTKMWLYGCCDLLKGVTKRNSARERHGGTTTN